MAEGSSGRMSNGAPPNTPTELWDLLPGYAMDMLEGRERQEAERLLASDAGARQALDEYREALAAFVVEAEPPAALRAGVLRQVRSTPQLPPDPPGPRSAPDEAGVVLLSTRRRRGRLALAAVSVAAAAAIAVPTTIAVQVTAQRDQLREQGEIVSQMLVDPDASVLRGPVEGGGEATMVVADGDMFFRADSLPEPAAGKAYQLWVVGGDGSVSSAGMLSVQDGQTTSLVRGSDGVGLAVSVEPDSGSQQPTTDPIVVLGT